MSVTNVEVPASPREENRRVWIWRDAFGYPQISFGRPEGVLSTEYIRSDLVVGYLEELLK